MGDPSLAGFRSFSYRATGLKFPVPAFNRPNRFCVFLAAIYSLWPLPMNI
jgi:hypothetical protein